MGPSIVSSLFLAFAFQAAAVPTTETNQYAEHYLRRRNAMDIRHTTTTNSTVIDWIPLESQGKIASPPPSRFRVASNRPVPLAELQQPGVERGPPGTVPVPRINPDYLVHAPNKQQAPRSKSTSSSTKRQNSGHHWYVASTMRTPNLGGIATYSLFKAFVANQADFSLLQSCASRDAPKGEQTVEAGWINWPVQGADPHFFTFFTTNGYTEWGDNLMGWNTEVAGWVQVDDTIFPGTAFGPLSTDGGDQYELPVQTYLYNGDWWINVLDRWIGYYPGSIFRDAVNGATSLGDGSDEILFYGEISQDEQEVTTTDMGSGRFGDAGSGHAAYIHNMQYIDTDNVLQDYTGEFWDDDSSRYNHQEHLSSGEGWGSYVYLGGPGAGGVTGG